jgi:hypothetical protein
VLAHELAHIARRDPLRHVLTRLVVAAYWFHPLAWLAARQARAAQEQACDEAVLALGTRPSVYARVLMELAHSPTSRRPLAALPMAERPFLETRIMAILDAGPVSARGRRIILPAAAVALLTLSLAVAQPVLTAQRGDASMPGLPASPLSALPPVPSARVQVPAAAEAPVAVLETLTARLRAHRQFADMQKMAKELARQAIVNQSEAVRARAMAELTAFEAQLHELTNSARMLEEGGRLAELQHNLEQLNIDEQLAALERDLVELRRNLELRRNDRGVVQKQLRELERAMRQMILDAR